jgi:hypothetical protein
LTICLIFDEHGLAQVELTAASEAEYQRLHALWTRVSPTALALGRVIAEEHARLSGEDGVRPYAEVGEE